MRSLAAVFVLIISIFSSTDLQAQNLSVKEQTRVIPTYPFSDPDPVPVFFKKPQIYPYQMFNGYSHSAVQKKWKSVTLENDYISLSVLPESGGKVFGAVEKSTGKEFIYQNDALKFRQIALRGPWTSGGIEFNFGIVGHTPATASPVDYIMKSNKNGTGSCIIGCMDLPSRTRWWVEINLPADKAYFQTVSHWYNPTPFNQSYYHWSTGAISAKNDLQYFYPGKYVVPHSTTTKPDTWPVDNKGRDLSWYKNNNFGGSKTHFVLGKYADFFGNYFHDEQFGMGHWALYDEIPGKKVWIWALSRAGAIWEKLLTDSHGQYSEPQAGRLFSQADHEFFQPGGSDNWTEVWFPFKETGGLTYASPVAALNTEYGNSSIVISLCPLQNINDDLVVHYGDREVFREKLHLKPMEVYKKEVLLPAFHGNYIISIGDKFRYDSTPDVNDIKRPVTYPRLTDKTTEEKYLKAELMHKERKFSAALKLYKAVLEEEPFHLRALTHTAELYCRRGEYKTALKYAERALKLQKYNPGANYVYGVIASCLGDNTDAKETFGWAARSYQYRSDAYSRLAEILLRENRYSRAADYCRKAIESNAQNFRAYEICAIAERLANNLDSAKEILHRLSGLDPLNHLVSYELFKLDPSAEREKHFIQFIRQEFPHEMLLELALSYYQLGLADDAAEILQMSPEHPLTGLWLAYLCKNKSSGQTEQFLKAGLDQSPRFVFPFRHESIQVLTWAIDRKPDDWKPKYYLGLLYYHLGRKEQAADLLMQCSGADFPVCHIILGLIDTEHAEAHFKKAVELGRSLWRPWHYLAEYYIRAGQNEKGFSTAKEAASLFSGNVVLNMDLARTLFDNQRYTECIKLLSDLEVLPYEGGWEAHNLYKRANYLQGLSLFESGKYESAIKYFSDSKEYPEHLGTGEPYNVDTRLQDYLIARCYTKLKDTENADRCLKKIYKYTADNNYSPMSYPFIGYLAVKHEQSAEAAKKMLNEVYEKNQNNPHVKWCIDTVEGDTGGAQNIQNRYLHDVSMGIFYRSVRYLGDGQ